MSGEDTVCIREQVNNIKTYVRNCGSCYKGSHFALKGVDHLSEMLAKEAEIDEEHYGIYHNLNADKEEKVRYLVGACNNKS